MDGTLYPWSIGVNLASRKNIEDEVHARQVLKRLGLEDCFKASYALKLFILSLEPANITDASKIFFDDKARDIASVKAAGLRTSPRNLHNISINIENYK
ncbi:hypothetical protein V6N13_087108 [Hibiscus sabdariffa]